MDGVIDMAEHAHAVRVVGAEGVGRLIECVEARVDRSESFTHRLFHREASEVVHEDLLQSLAHHVGRSRPPP